MNNKVKEYVRNKSLASFRVNQWIGIYTKSEIAEMLNMTRPTLDSRLKKNTWRISEIEIIIKKLPF